MPPPPFYSQKANYHGEDSGFPSQTDIDQWEHNGCGIACARMVIGHFTGQRPRYWDLLQRGLERSAYIEAGWIHRGLVDLIGEYGITGQAQRGKTVDDLRGAIKNGSVCIVSVTIAFRGGQPHPETGQPYRKGGHLVLAYGIEDGSIVCHHPASRDEGNRPAWPVSHDRWERSFSGNFMEFRGGPYS